MNIKSGYLLTALSFASCGVSSKYELQNSNESSSYVRIPRAMLSESFVQKTGFQQDHGKNETFAIGWIPTSTLEKLPSEEKISITQLNEQDVTRGLLNPFSLANIPHVYDFASTAEEYHNYVALTAELKSLQARYSNFSELESVGKTKKGREIWLMRLSHNIAANQSKPKLLYVANMHGDEVVGRELSIYFIRYLLAGATDNPRIRSLLQGSEIFIIPSMNPDGFENSARANANGKDLNRNFPDFVTSPNDQLQGRELETQAIMNLHAKHHFVSGLNFHGGEVCFNLPWDTIQNSPNSKKFGDDHILAPMGRAWADANPTMEANTSFDRGLTYGYEWYPVHGGLQDWSIYYRGSMHATVELSYVKWPPKTQLPIAWEENREAMLSHLERSILGVHAFVTNSVNGSAVENVTVNVASSTRSVAFKTAYTSRATTEGRQVVTFKAAGYQQKTLEIDATMFDGNYEQVSLDPQ
jgi:carboxypeptidase D